MSTRTPLDDCEPRNLVIYEEVRDKLGEIPTTLSVAQMKGHIISKCLGARPDTEKCIFLNKIILVMIIRYYHGRHPDCDREELKTTYQSSITKNGIAFLLNKLPERLIRNLYVIAEKIKP